MKSVTYSSRILSNKPSSNSSESLKKTLIYNKKILFDSSIKFQFTNNHASHLWQCVMDFFSYTPKHQLDAMSSFISISILIKNTKLKSKQMRKICIFLSEAGKKFSCFFLCLYWYFMLLTFIIESHLNAHHSDSVSSCHLFLFTLHERWDIKCNFGKKKAERRLKIKME